MTEDEQTDSREVSDADLSITLDPPDALAYDELVEEFGAEVIDGDINEVVKKHIRSLYDNQHRIRRDIENARHP